MKLKDLKIKKKEYKAIMIDENKIEEASYDFEDGELIEDKLKRAAFKCGIKWFKENLWHDVSEIPKEHRICLVKIRIINEFVVGSDYTTSSYNEKGWTDNFFPENADIEVTRWLYIDDLIEDKKANV